MNRNFYVIFIYFMFQCNSLDAVNCKLFNGVYNCSNQNLTDCPTLNSNAKRLILDHNFLTKLDTKKCSKWSDSVILVRWNKLTKLDINFTVVNLDVSHNSIKAVRIRTDTIQKLFISHNRIDSFLIDRESHIDTLDISWNNLNEIVIENIFDQIMNKIEYLYMESNNIISTQSKWITFKPTSLKLMSLAGNKFQSINFGSLPRGFISNHRYKFDLSNNNIYRWEMVSNDNLKELNLSRNNLSTIDFMSFSKLKNLKKLDLSYNPILCNCAKFGSFIEWVNRKRSMFYNSKNTKCSDTKIELLKMKCSNTSSTTTTSKSTTTTEKGSTTTKHTFISTTIVHHNTTTIPSTKSSHIGVICGVLGCFGILCLIIFSCYCKKRRQNSSYIRIGGHNYGSFGSESIPDPIDREVDNDSIKILCNSRHKMEIEMFLTKVRNSMRNCQLTLVTTSQSQWKSRFVKQNLDLATGKKVVVIIRDSGCYDNDVLRSNVEHLLKHNCEDRILLMFVNEPNEDDFKGGQGPFFDFISKRYNDNQYDVLKFNSEEAPDQFIVRVQDNTAGLFIV